MGRVGGGRAGTATFFMQVIPPLPRIASMQGRVVFREGRAAREKHNNTTRRETLLVPSPSHLGQGGGSKGSRYTSLMIYVCPIGQVRELLHHGDLHCMQQRRSAISVRLGALLHDLLRWDPVGIEVERGKRGFAESCARP